MSAPTVVVVTDEPAVVAEFAERLLRRLCAAQAARGTASLVLAGGGVALAGLRAVSTHPHLEDVDWARVDLWWSDERFVPADDPERNALQARQALLDALPLDPARVHPMGASDGPDSSADDAAARYARELAQAAGTGTELPWFDVLLLGMGPEGHTASLFPDAPAVHDDRVVVAVLDCPKPPPTRLSLGLSAFRHAREVWFLVSGAAKAEAVAAALGGADPVRVPAAGPRGRDVTLWLLDVAAASALPADQRPT